MQPCHCEEPAAAPVAMPWRTELIEPGPHLGYNVVIARRRQRRRGNLVTHGINPARSTFRMWLQTAIVERSVACSRAASLNEVRENWTWPGPLPDCSTSPHKTQRS